MSTLRLVPVSGPPIDVVKDQSTVGRDPSCDVVVTDGSVSRHHSRLERRGSEWWVVDQGSANGTYVNSLRVAEQVLKNGQELRFGALGFRVDVIADSEATVATQIMDEPSAAAPARPTPPPVPARQPAATAPAPPPAPAQAAAPPPLPRAQAWNTPAPPRAASPAPPPVARHAGPPVAPVPQMSAGPPPAKKGRSPFFWVAIGCCGCLVLLAAIAAVIGGGAYMATRGAAEAAHTWLAEVRAGQTEQAQAGLTSAYRERLSSDDFETIASKVRDSTDATFPSRSVDNGRAKLTGVLTGSGSPQPIVVTLVKEGGAWKVDDVSFGIE